MWSPFVFAIMEALKKSGIARNSTIKVLSALLVGPIIVVGWQVGATLDHSIPVLVTAVYTGIMASLIAMGVYTGLKNGR